MSWVDSEKIFKLDLNEDCNDVTFTGQRIRWTKDPQSGSCIQVSQQKDIDELEEIPVERNKRSSPLYPHSAYKVLKPPRTNKLVTEQDTISVLPQILHMCFKGSFPNNWRCEGSQQADETTQVTASETSVLATHKTVEDNWIS